MLRKLKQSMIYSHYNRQIATMISKIDKLHLTLLKLQSQTSDVSHLFVNKERIKTEMDQLDKEFKIKVKKFRNAKDRKEREILHDEIMALGGKLSILKSDYRDLLRDVNLKMRDLRSSFRSYRENFREFGKVKFRNR